ncbi:fatty acyl-CoA reductase wat-like [Polistes fuscatus]|uniref:fatty acyl-CoA reductase wat-like n=1 Tax=Polistes fuscatus TaxID=30207 RepID=UPI001CA87D35|nr:fatty acyl-CoA reductase wat-like [Polistes fuscatus]
MVSLSGQTYQKELFSMEEEPNFYNQRGEIATFYSGKKVLLTGSLGFLGRLIMEKLLRLLGNWPNTYAYSKAICEDTVRQYSNGIPACIVRPSIVVATGKEPIAGWISNLYGIIGIAVESATGVLHTLYCNENFICNIIPVDYVVKNIIAAAWDVAQKQLLKIYRNIEKFKYVMNYFTFTEWEFTNVTNDNVLKLWDKISVVDKHKFFFNVSDIDWECFSNAYIKGVRVYLLKDPMETVDESRPFYRR